MRASSSGLRRIATLAIALGVAASTTNCSSGTRTGAVGTPCSADDDCEYGICVRIEGVGDVCSSACIGDENCIPGWACTTVEGLADRICGCAVATETCDGRDQDCDGRIDEGGGAALGCVDGECVGGGCVFTGDAGAPPQALYGACSVDTDCDAGLWCHTAYPTRFCTVDCTSEAECGAEGYCAYGTCVPRCAPGARDCDQWGAACAQDTFCVPTCDAAGIDTATCPADRPCDPWGGDCRRNPTFGDEIGAPCTRAEDCRTGLCYPEVSGGRPSGFVGGMCIGATRSRGPAAPPERGGCPVGSVTAIGEPEGDIVFCLPECDTDADCRPGYFCGRPVATAPAYCVPIDCDFPGVRACPAGTTCQAVGSVRRCVACDPMCTGRDCGPDGCGGTCGACTGAFTCGATGVCECTGETDAELCGVAGAECGTRTATDRCGRSRSIACGACTAPETCGAITSNQCDCAPETDAMLCAAAGATCDAISRTDRCGADRVAECGTCTPPQTCGAITANRCGCVAETDAELCAARGAECGVLSTTDRCGVGRSVSCGSCALPETCAGAGVPNTCGMCVPSCGARVCGGDGCGGSCGSCPSGQRCNASGACEPIPCDPVLNSLCPAGQKCDWTGSATACAPAGTGLGGDSCVGSFACAAEHTCVTEGFCREYCTRSSDCRGGAVCALDLTGSPYGACSVPCDPTYDAWVFGTDGCVGYDCRIIDTTRASGVADCGPTGSRSEGATCSAAAPCDGGLACAGGRCRRVCELGFACAGGGTCMTVPGWPTYGVCM